MPRFEKRTDIDASADALYAWHARPGAFERLSPPWDDVRTVSGDTPVDDGARRVIELRKGPIRKRWVALHSDVEPGRGFVDTQESGPFRSWRHVHRFEPLDAGRSRLVDSIEYALPFGALGSALGSGFVERQLERTFRYRHAVTAGDLARHTELHVPEPLTVAVTGSTGLIGTALVAQLRTAGHRVKRVVRRSDAGPDAIEWHPATGAIDSGGFEGVDVVVHLAGENVAGGRWSEARKARIRDSRVDGTELLARALASLERKPRALVCASAVGYYGDRGEEVCDETSSAGEGFLAKTCVEWEAAARPAVDAGLRVAHVRIGVVLTPAGGALAKMLPPFLAGVGGRIGSGRFFMPWIAHVDVVDVFHAAIVRDDLSGALNAVAPQSVRNAEFTETLGRVLARPTLFPVPPVALRALYGQMADEVLMAGANVRPGRLETAGFRFRQPDLESALRFCLGR